MINIYDSKTQRLLGNVFKRKLYNDNGEECSNIDFCADNTYSFQFSGVELKQERKWNVYIERNGWIYAAKINLIKPFVDKWINQIYFYYDPDALLKCAGKTKVNKIQEYIKNHIARSIMAKIQPHNFNCSCFSCTTYSEKYEGVLITCRIINIDKLECKIYFSSLKKNNEKAIFKIEF